MGHKIFGDDYNRIFIIYFTLFLFVFVCLFTDLIILLLIYWFTCLFIYFIMHSTYFY